MTAPVIMKITIHPVLKLSLPASKNGSQLSCRRAKPMIKAPPAPIAPACVGLNQPRNNPPIAKRNRTMVSIIPVTARSFCFQVVGAPGGPMRGLRQQRRTTVATNERLRSIPGNTPAIKSLPMDSSVIILKTMRKVLGGIRIPSVPETATVPVASVSLYS